MKKLLFITLAFVALACKKEKQEDIHDKSTWFMMDERDLSDYDLYYCEEYYWMKPGAVKPKLVLEHFGNSPQSKLKVFYIDGKYNEDGSPKVYLYCIADHGTKPVNTPFEFYTGEKTIIAITNKF